MAATLDLDRCSFFRPIGSDRGAGATLADELLCWAEASPRKPSASEQEERCPTLRHTRCPILLAALARRPSETWSRTETAAHAVAESCHLGQARLEVQVQRLDELGRVFDDAEA